MDDFTAQEIAAVYRAIALRRDMRHFLPEPLDEALVERLLGAAHMAPSVGLMQPWRFIRIRDRRLRASIHALVEAERVKTAQALAEREDEFMRLKVEGILECGELLIAALADGREGHIFGRRTMPEMDLASVACAIQNLWLAARAENVGMGWVSLFDPEALRQLLRMPEGSRPVAVLCLGYVPAFYPRPMLEEVDWAHRFDLNTLVHTDYWSDGSSTSSSSNTGGSSASTTGSSSGASASTTGSSSSGASASTTGSSSSGASASTSTAGSGGAGAPVPPSRSRS